ncbi:pentatricopeptide repeat-containing protein At1g12300, mitochondrial-like [Coffea eugenioides]|uniref:pentatricopeptide repeat-containing protein At1g12300, mitochondrial-like n=1 Tax=Coffea eugenioides TaxID=49369 RepID=UPI000F612565|nr:pentatricopeptide repeat-containing protein At1g12300, mitochondrial-like [Coffea eugenioides]
MLLNQMSHFSIAPSHFTHCILIDAFSREGSMQDAEDVFEIMIQRGENPGTVIYNALMNGCYLQGQMDKARKIFDAMVERGANPDILSYSTLMNAHFKKNENDEAMHLLREIPQRGLRADVGTYNIVLQGLFRMGRYRSAREVFIEMRAASLPPDFHTYCTMLDGLCKCGHIEEGLQFLQKMEFDRVKLDITMYNIILHVLCKSGRFQFARDLFNNLSLLDEAKEFFVKMEEISCSANGITFSFIAQELLRRGEYNDALRFLEEMARRGFKMDSYTFSILIDLLQDKENYPSLMQIIEKFGPNELKSKS